MAYSDNSFDAVWEELRKGNPELIAKVDQRVAEILSREKQRGCPPDCNPGFCDDPDEEICDRCWASWGKRRCVSTNADLILASTDVEQLADRLMPIMCMRCAVWGLCAGAVTKKSWHAKCLSQALEWLKQEGKE